MQNTTFARLFHYRCHENITHLTEHRALLFLVIQEMTVEVGIPGGSFLRGAYYFQPVLAME